MRSGIQSPHRHGDRRIARHLATQRDLTPEDDRSTFGLKDDDPLIAPSYAAQRAALAKRIGLGWKPEPEKPAKGAAKKASGEKG